MPGIGRCNHRQLDTLSWQSAQIEDRGYNANGLLTSIDRAFEDEESKGVRVCRDKTGLE